MTIYEGENNVQFRMYEERFKSLVQGWTKYLSVGASQIHPKVMLAIMIWLMGSIHTAVMLLLSFFIKPFSKFKTMTTYMLYTIQFIILHKRVVFFSLILLILHLILVIFFVVIFLNSWRHAHFSTSVEWKGRSFKIN